MSGIAGAGWGGSIRILGDALNPSFCRPRDLNTYFWVVELVEEADGGSCSWTGADHGAFAVLVQADLVIHHAHVAGVVDGNHQGAKVMY
jgi:hypothetical protein